MARSGYMSEEGRSCSHRPFAPSDHPAEARASPVRTPPQLGSESVRIHALPAHALFLMAKHPPGSVVVSSIGRRIALTNVS
jgi:hypothetical protein